MKTFGTCCNTLYAARGDGSSRFTSTGRPPMPCVDKSAAFDSVCLKQSQSVPVRPFGVDFPSVSAHHTHSRVEVGVHVPPGHSRGLNTSSTASTASTAAPAAAAPTTQTRSRQTTATVAHPQPQPTHGAQRPRRRRSKRKADVLGAALGLA